MTHSQAPGGPALASLVRRAGPALVRASLAAAPDRLRRRRLARQAGDRHHQHLERHQRLPRASALARRRREARRAAGRRLSAGAAGDLAGRAVRQADDHALPQLPGDGDGGAAALAPDRRRRAARRLRQDHAGADHGRDLHGAAGDLLPAGPMLRGNWRGQTLGSGSDVWKYWDEKRAGKITEADWAEIEERHRALVRHLHDHGHGRHHDGHRRGAGSDAAGRLVACRQPMPASAHVRAGRPAHRRHGVGGPHARPDPHAGRVRERHHGAHGDGRLDQCHHPRGRHGAACGHRARRWSSSTRSRARCR